MSRYRDLRLLARTGFQGSQVRAFARTCFLVGPLMVGCAVDAERGATPDLTASPNAPAGKADDAHESVVLCRMAIQQLIADWNRIAADATDWTGETSDLPPYFAMPFDEIMPDETSGSCSGMPEDLRDVLTEARAEFAAVWEDYLEALHGCSGEEEDWDTEHEYLALCDNTWVSWFDGWPTRKGLADLQEDLDCWAVPPDDRQQAIAENPARPRGVNWCYGA